MRGQVLGNGRDERVGASRRRAGDARHTERGRHGAREGVDLAGLHGQAVIGAAAGDRGRGFGHVEPAEAIRVGVEAAARGKGARVLHAEGVLGGQEVGVEREHDVGLLEVVDRLDVAAEREPGAGAHVVARGRFPLNPLGVGMLRENLLDLRRERGRVDRLGDDAQTGAARGRLGRQRAAQGRNEAAPRTNLPKLGDRVRAIGVVHREHRGLREQVGAAAAGGMVGIAFDLGRAAFVALDQQARGHASERHRRGVEHRLAGHQIFGLTHVRHDQLVGLHRASRDAGQRQRGAHQLQEVAAADRVVELGRVGGELAVQELLEFRSFRNGFQAAPILWAVGRLQLRANGREI